MSRFRRLSRTAAVLACAYAFIVTGAAQGRGSDPPSIPSVAAETVGFSSARLDSLHTIIQDEVHQGQLAGAVTILARHEKIVDFRTYGSRDMATRAPMSKDTIFRVYSMTKPITGVAMMILYEQGKWLPQDPLAKHIPEFEHLQVLAGVEADGKLNLVAPVHVPTVRELMSHTAGFSYGNDKTGVDPLYQQAKVMQSANLKEMIDKLARLPLDYQPGTRWKYSASMDIEGFLIERLSGQTLPDFMAEHIFAPLAMKDTGFYVAADKRARLATNYDAAVTLTSSEPGPGHGPVVPGLAPTSAGNDDYKTQPTMPSGGGGLVSTAYDYYRFAQMLANGGVLEGKRVLSPATVRLMTTNKLTDNLLTGQFGIGQHVMRPGFGYGFNGAVIIDPGLAALPDGKGTYFWDGAAGTWFWVDPANDVVFVGMIQRMHAPDNHPLLYRTHAAVYGALVDPAK